ncbi:hypothetical protein P168DRAFT_224540, partial [Aspergillus campestris IBT 28561]
LRRLIFRIRYSRLRDYTPRGTNILHKAESLVNLNRIPLPLLDKETDPGQEWIKGVLLCAWGCSAILALNVILAIIAIVVAYKRPSYSDRHFEYAELYRGSCSTTNGWTTGMHLVINVLSTALLAASNYSMQCLSAPSRADIDQAHSKRTWLDIGVFSARNLWAMDARRKLLWVILFISSVPVHMMYNSAIFPSITTREYGLVVIPDDPGMSEPLTRSEDAHLSFTQRVGYSPEDVRAEYLNRTLKPHIDVSECLKPYDIEYNTKKGTLLLVVPAEHIDGSPIVGSFDWDTPFPFHIGARRFGGNLNNLTYPGWSLRAPGNSTWLHLRDFFDDHWFPFSKQCQFYFSLPISLTVIGCNIAKVICMYLTARCDRRSVLLTLGDGLSSFLHKPDITTKGRCLMSKLDMTTGELPWCRDPYISDTLDTTPLGEMRNSQPVQLRRLPQRLPRRSRWVRSPGWKPWTLTLTFFLACLGTSIFLFHLGFLGTTPMWAQEMGKPTGDTVFYDGGNVILLILLANSPQLTYSFLYFLCNGLLTNMRLAVEFNDFATNRKPLRVSWPKGQQRSAYYISLPYRYGFPLIAVSTIMHWLLSQSLFVVKIRALDVYDNELEEESTTACSWSSKAILWTIVVGSLAMGVLIGLGFRRLPSDMPLASSCSAAISASCHPPPEDTEVSLKPVKWGEIINRPRTSTGIEEASEHISENDHAEDTQIEYAHCSLTSEPVMRASPNVLYC